LNKNINCRIGAGATTKFFIIMKKLLFFVAALSAAISFSACSNDDDHDGVDMNLLHGSWQETRYYGYELRDGEKVSEWDDLMNEESVYTFDKYGGGNYRNPGGVWNIQYTQEGNILQLTSMGRGETFHYTWTIEDLTPTQMKATQYSKWEYKDATNAHIYEEYETMILKRIN